MERMERTERARTSGQQRPTWKRASALLVALVLIAAFVGFWKLSHRPSNEKLVGGKRLQCVSDAECNDHTRCDEFGMCVPLGVPVQQRVGGGAVLGRGRDGEGSDVQKVSGTELKGQRG